MLYYRLIEQHLENQDSVFWDDSHSMSYMELHKAVMGFAKRMEAYVGTGGKDGTVLIVSCSCMDACIAVLSCISLGIRYSVVHEIMTAARKKYIIENSNAILVIGQNADWITDPQIPFLNMRDVWDSFLQEPAERKKPVSLEKDAYILYTSGTTELPKGVLAGYGQIAFLVKAINHVLKNSSDDIIWNCLPLAFDYGMYQLFLALDSEASFYISDQPLIPLIPKILAEKAITAFPAVPSLIGMLLKSQLLQRVSGFIRLRYISSTGDTLPVRWIKEMEKSLPGTVVIPMYGITECKRVAVMPLEDKEKKYLGSCGLPLPGVDVVLADAEQPAELIVYGPNVMKGYWKVPEETQKSFGFDEKRKQWYLKTGDLFRQDTEGYLYFVERKSGFIKSNGYRISGREIDAFFIENVSGIYECCTVGVPDPDIGQRIVTVIYGICHMDELDRQVCLLPAYLRPHKVVILDFELPKTANGKFDKKKIVEMAGKE